MSEVTTTTDSETPYTEAKLLLTLSGPITFLSIQGRESKKMGTGELQILQLSDTSILLHCEPIFSYALSKPIPSVRASPNSFVFVGSDGECFGILLPTSSSSEDGIPPADLDVFLALLSEFSDFVSKVTVISTAAVDSAAESTTTDTTTDTTPTTTDTSTTEEPPTSEEEEESGKKVAKYGFKAAGILKKGTAMTTTGIAKGTALTTTGIRKAKIYAKGKIKKRGIAPDDGSTVYDEDGINVVFDGKEEVQVSEKTRSRILKAKSATVKGVQISGSIVSGATSLIMELTQTAVTKASDTSVGQKISTTAETSETAMAAKEVAKASLLGIITIRAALDDAVMAVLEETVESGADIARHAYGDQVGDAADDTGDVIVGGAEIVRTINDMGARHLAKDALIKSGAEATMDEEDRSRIQDKRKAELSQMKSKALSAKSALSSKVKAKRAALSSATVTSDSGDGTTPSTEP